MRHLGTLATTLTALMLLPACSNDDSPAKASPTAEQRESTATQPPDYTTLGDPRLDGPGRWGVTAFGDPDAPITVLDVPQGFQGHESWVWTDTQGPGEFGQLAVWKPTDVPINPCHPRAPSPPLGPTAKDLATALAAQQLTTTTKPVAVTMDGHQGLYLELTSPRRFDYQGCGPDGMQIWKAGNTEGRLLGEPVTDRYWIIDVDGQRLVISALTLPAATTETVELLTGVVASTDFVTHG